VTSGSPRRGWLTLATAAVLLVPAVAGCDEKEPAAEASPSPAATVKSYEKSVTGVVEAAEAFLDTLDSDQKAEVQLEFTEQNATSWSNLPCGSVCRPGIKLGDLDAHQLTAAKSVLKTAFGSAGYVRSAELMAADDHLAGPSPSPVASPAVSAVASPAVSAVASPSAAAPDLSGYGSGLYFLAFLGEPSEEGAWQLAFGGHHLAVHLTYRGGQVVSASPYFAGVEPVTWTDSGGVPHEPLRDMRDGLLAMTRGLTKKQQKAGRLDQAFTDVLAGPGQDGRFPATKQGLAVRTLDARRQALVLAAIKPWVANADDATATALLTAYQGELDGTFISWAGGGGLDRHGDYVRIDGPGVWIEFAVQTGAVFPDQVNFHTVYRDRTRDYGGGFSFS
jgi:hypothetical protein